MKFPKKTRAILGLMYFLVVQAKGEQKQQCNLKDTTGIFTVDGTKRRCLWAKRHTYGRCEIDAVRTNCPKTCNVPCIHVHVPTNRPSSAMPEPTNGPSSAMMDSTTFTSCEDEDNLQDTVFTLDGVERSCLWAKRVTEMSCTIDLVQKNCPSTCSIPCTSSVELLKDPDPVPVSAVVHDKDKMTEQTDGDHRDVGGDAAPIIVNPTTSGSLKRTPPSMLTLLVLGICWVIA